MALLNDPDYLLYRMRQDFEQASEENREFMPLAVSAMAKDSPFLDSLYVAASKLVPEELTTRSLTNNNPNHSISPKLAYDPYAVYKRNLFPTRRLEPRKMLWAQQPANAELKNQNCVSLECTSGGKVGQNGATTTVSFGESESVLDSDGSASDCASVGSQDERANGGTLDATPIPRAQMSEEEQAKSKDIQRRGRRKKLGVGSTALDFKFQKLDAVFAAGRPGSPFQRNNGYSVLSDLIKATIGFVNPFAEEFQCFSARGDPEALHLKILVPHNRKPLSMAVTTEALVQDTIGVILYQYVEERRQPELPSDKHDVTFWNLRLLDDDGEIEEDFPALDRTRKMQKFGFDSFALCLASSQEVAKNAIVRKQLLALKQRSNSASASSGAGNSSTQPGRAPGKQGNGTGGDHPTETQGPVNAPVDGQRRRLNNVEEREFSGQNSSASDPGSKEFESSSSRVLAPGGLEANQPQEGRQIILKIHLYSTLEVKQTTMITAYANMKMEDVFQLICAKKKYSCKDYVLKMADTKTDVPVDKELAQLNCVEFCVLKRGGGAGDIFLRPPEETNDESSAEGSSFSYRGGSRDPGAAELALRYKQYSISQKQLMGRHEKLLTIESDTIHLAPAETKAYFDTSKSSSYHINSVLACKQTRPSSPTFKLTVAKGSNMETNTGNALAVASGTALGPGVGLHRPGGSISAGGSGPGVALGNGVVNLDHVSNLQAANMQHLGNNVSVLAPGNLNSSTATSTFIGSTIGSSAVASNISSGNQYAILANIDSKSYEFEATSATEANDICQHIRLLMHKRDLRLK